MFVRVSDLQQHDRQVAGDGVAPQSRLPAPVAQENAGLRAQRRIGEDHGARKARVELRIRLGGIDLPQRHAAVRPREIEDAVRQMPVLVFADEAQRGVARLGHAEGHVDRSPSAAGRA